VSGYKPRIKQIETEDVSRDNINHQMEKYLWFLSSLLHYEIQSIHDVLAAGMLHTIINVLWNKFYEHPTKQYIHY
jgi:hypothetical protein